MNFINSERDHLACSLETDAEEGMSAWPWIAVSSLIIAGIWGFGFFCGAKWVTQ